MSSKSLLIIYLIYKTKISSPSLYNTVLSFRCYITHYSTVTKKARSFTLHIAVYMTHDINLMEKDKHWMSVSLCLCVCVQKMTRRLSIKSTFFIHIPIFRNEASFFSLVSSFMHTSHLLGWQFFFLEMKDFCLQSYYECFKSTIHGSATKKKLYVESDKILQMIRYIRGCWTWHL